MSGVAVDLTGKKFARLTVIERVENSKSGVPRWKCICECGNECIVYASHLKNGNTKSCGCLQKELSAIRCKEQKKTHGKSNTRIYKIWRHMKDRCYNPKNKDYKLYGAEGKTICDEWINSFQNFYDWSMSHGYQEQLEIDRIDWRKGYYPDNCRWVTRKEQNNNNRNNHIIEYKGKKQTMSQWAEELNINYSTLRSRVNELGWTIDKALETLKNKKR